MDAYLNAELTAQVFRPDKALVEKHNRAAIWYLDRLLAHESKDWKLFDRRGLAHVDLGQDELAEADYRRAVALGPDASFFYRELGATQGTTGWALPLAQAMGRGGDDYAHLIQLGTDDPSLWQMHGLLRLYVGDMAGYRQACKELVKRTR